METKTKICSKCGVEKELSEFCLRRDTGRYRNSCKDCDNKRQRQYRSNNKEKVSKAKKKYYNKNKERIKEYKKRYRSENAEIVKERERLYRDNNKEIINANRKKYYENNKEKFKEYNKARYIKNKKKIREYEKIRKRNDVGYSMSCKLRSRLRRALKGNYKSGSAIKDLGCSISFLKSYIEKLFEPNMSWNNYGEWHIDHIVPLASFDLSDREQLLKACHYTNLQPLWAKDNLSKGSKLDWEKN
jgi:hypothetical protein